MSTPQFLFYAVALGASVLLIIDTLRLRREARRVKRELQRLREDQHLDRTETDWQRYVRRYEERRTARD